MTAYRVRMLVLFAVSLAVGWAAAAHGDPVIVAAWIVGFGFGCYDDSGRQEEAHGD